MIHYGMSSVTSYTTIFDVMATTFTAVVVHELFKEAALDANCRLDFGIEWQQIFKDLSDFCLIELEDSTATKVTVETLRETFDRLDDDGSGGLDEDELKSLFESLGRKVSRRTISNLMRLSDTDGNGIIDWEEFQAIWERFNC